MTQKENDEIRNLKNEKEQEKRSERKKEIQEIISKKRNIPTKVILLGEILNPQKYTGITERDFHLYETKKGYKPNYVHIEPDAKPKCSCIMYAKKYEDKDLITCDHISFVINDVLNLKENSELKYTEEELKKAFENAEQKNKNLIRET